MTINQDIITRIYFYDNDDMFYKLNSAVHRDSQFDGFYNSMIYFNKYAKVLIIYELLNY